MGTTCRIESRHFEHCGRTLGHHLRAWLGYRGADGNMA
jgi:hypothetical protein